MPKYKVLIARITVSGNHRQEATNFLIDAALYARDEPRIEDVINLPISRTPTPVARNLVIHEARTRHGMSGNDVVMMLDDDMSFDSAFFRAAFEFLVAHNGPAAIGCPYVSAPGEREDVMVFEWAAGESNTAETPWAVTNIVREDAARRAGIEEVANIGTGCIAYRMDCFDRIVHPYFDYSYSDDKHIQVIETEDCYLHRRLHLSGIPVYCSWNHWANHYKIKQCGKPLPIFRETVQSAFRKDMTAALKHEERQKASMGALTDNGAPVQVGLNGANQ